MFANQLEVLLCLLAVVLPRYTLDARSDANVDIETEFPLILSIKTNKTTASSWSGQWDIIRGESRRINEGNGENARNVELAVVVHSQAELNVFHQLKEEGVIDQTMNTTMTQRHLQRQSSEFATSFPCYRTVDEIIATLDDLAIQYPEFVTIETIGPSYNKTQNGGNDGGYDIPVLIINAPSGVVEKAPMMIVAGLHARELAPVETVLRWAEYLLENYGLDADVTDVLNRTMIHVVPVANPDGRLYVENYLEWSYRKNTHARGCSDGIPSDGTDLNRNFPLWYGFNSGSSNDLCSNSYRGPQAMSEPETQAIYQYADALFPDGQKKGIGASGYISAEARASEECPLDAKGIYLDVHSYGELLYFPWGYEDRTPPNVAGLLAMASKLAHPGDYLLWGPGQEDFLYTVSGDAVDSMFGVMCVPSYGYEVGSTFYEDCYNFENQVLGVNFDSFMYAAKSAQMAFSIPQGPDVLSIDVDQSSVNKVTLAATVSDSELTRFEFQSIRQVRVFVDEHPHDGAIGIAMEARDGSFDEANEVAVVEIDTTTWGDEQHTLFFQAEDMDSFKGPVAAIFLAKDDSDSVAPDPSDDATLWRFLIDVLSRFLLRLLAPFQ